MNKTVLLWLGVLLTVTASFGGLVVAPGWQQRALTPIAVEDAEGGAARYPALPDDPLLARGRAVYRAEGCIYCHSQQVRPESAGADLARGWGQRRSVPRDYLFDRPPLLGTMRTGPDLANIGARQPSDDWHHLHLYDARTVSPGSVMPPFGYLYERTTRAPPATAAGRRAVKLPPRAGSEPQAGAASDTWIVPGDDARALVAYIKSLEQAHALEKVQ